MVGANNVEIKYSLWPMT